MTLTQVDPLDVGLVPKGIEGFITPRLHTPYLEGPSKIDEVEEFANWIGMPLMKWQRHVLQDMLQIDEQGNYRRKLIGLLCSRQNGKTYLAQVLILAKMYLWGETVLGMAHKRDMALHTWKSVLAIIEANPDLLTEVKSSATRRNGFMAPNGSGIMRANGAECITLKNGATYRIAASTEGGARGLTADFLFCDELLLWTPEGWAAARPVTTARMNAQTFVASNAGSAHSEILNDVRERALSYPNSSFAWYEYSAEPTLKITNKLAWQQANPAMGTTISEFTLTEYLATMPTDHFKREHLCQWVDAIGSPWPYGVIEATSDSNLSIDAGGVIIFGIDVSPSKQSGALVAGKIINGKVAVGLLQLWRSEIAIDDLKMASEIMEWVVKLRPTILCYDKYATASIAQRLEQSGIKCVDNSGQEFYQSCGELLDSFVHNRIIHSGQEDLVAHLNNCAAKTNDAGWRIIRRKSAGSVAAAIALAMVNHQLIKPQSTPQIIT